MSEPASEQSSTGSPERILIVEDYDAAAQSLARLLRTCGFEVSVVNDGASALEALKSSPPPDIVLTDLQLPDIDGREVAQAASQLPQPPRVALVTGWSNETVQDGMAEWGIDWVLSKPVVFEELLRLLGREMPQPPRSGAGRERPAEGING